jgi:hypothetical protein
MDFPQDSPRYTSPKPGGGLYGDSYFMGKMIRPPYLFKKKLPDDEMVNESGKGGAKAHL